MFLHFIEELGCKPNRSGDVLDIKFIVARLNKILQEQCKLLEKLVNFCHENHWQVCNAVRVVAQPSFCF